MVWVGESKMNGIIIIDKKKGYTSHDIVAILRKALNIKRIGHIGTLDPNAQGVLPILIGQATKVSKYLMEHDKTYVATIKLGEKRDTGDSEGEIIEIRDTKELKLEEKDIEKILYSFIGRQKQTPPMYSAIKVSGKKLYEYAREGKKIEVQKRDIEIYNIELQKVEKDEITFKLKCSKGTYIRTLCEDIAEKLGTVGYMKELTRIEVDKFNIKDAIEIEDIKNDAKLVEKNLITIEEVFKDSESVILDQKKLELFLNGVMLNVENENGIYRVYNDNRFIGLGEVKNNLLKRDVII